MPFKRAVTSVIPPNLSRAKPKQTSKPDCFPSVRKVWLKTDSTFYDAKFVAASCEFPAATQRNTNDHELYCT